MNVNIYIYTYIYIYIYIYIYTRRDICDDKVQGIILNFWNHPSILKIKEKFQLKRFSFLYVSEATVTKVVKNLPSDKVSADKIPIKILQESTFCFLELTNCINESLTINFKIH